MEQVQLEVALDATAPSRKAIWTGWILGAIPVLLMAMSSVMKFSRSAQLLESWRQFGYPEGTLIAIAAAELACAVLYAVPRTAVLGAILVTGFLGGATATHIRVGQTAFVAPVVLGVLAWAGLFLREPRLRALLPLRRDA